MTRYLAGLVLSLVPVVVAAQAAAPETPCPACLHYYRTPEGKTNLLEDISLDREEPLRAILLNTAEYGQLHLVIFYTYSTATHVLVRLSCSVDDKAFTTRSTDMLETEGRNQRYLPLELTSQRHDRVPGEITPPFSLQTCDELRIPDLVPLSWWHGSLVPRIRAAGLRS